MSRDSKVRLCWFYAFWTKVIVFSETSGLGLCFLSCFDVRSYFKIKAIIEMVLCFFKKRSVSLETRGSFRSLCLYVGFYRLFYLWVILNTEGREHFIQNRSFTTVLRKPKKKCIYIYIYIYICLSSWRRPWSSNAGNPKSACMLALRLSVYIRNCVEVHIPWRHAFVDTYISRYYQKSILNFSSRKYIYI
jgi:hypothetical protein